ncbi:hypothetical protein QF022_000618 [Vogesella perlucida]|nr:hypothetical protein [Vogesella perlucida]
MIDKKSKKFDINKRIKAISALAIFLFILVLGFYFSKFNVRLSSVNGDWGTFGDFLGGTLNPIFSLMSLIALLYTIALQTDEMAQTREELSRTADAQKKAEEALNGQLNAQRKQIFETTFFSLLDQHNKTLEKLISKNESRSSKESDLEWIRSGITGFGIRSIEKQREIIHTNNNLCGSYFRVLYRILKFISTDCYDKNKEKFYSGIVRSFIGNDVIQILACNCYCTDKDNQYFKYRLLIEKYAFLEHFSPAIVGDNNLFAEVVNNYNITAFGNNPLKLKLKEETQSNSLI